MADCWRSLRQEPGVELKVVVEQVDSGKEFDADSVLTELDHLVVSHAQRQRCGEWLGAWKPDVIFAVGWHSQVVREIVTRPEWKDIPKVCCFDLPWRWKLRCLAARFVLGPFLRHYAAAYVPGRACERYAKWLGFKKIQKGLFSIDQSRFSSTAAQGRREGFLYIGRFSDEKRIDLIAKAFARYRALGGTWPLDLYGAGRLPSEINRTIEQSNNRTIFFHPFVQPASVPRLYAEHACLLLASAFDPWPLVALEARASGCEVIQSDRCGNRFELDTRVVKYGDVEAMAREMLKVEREVASHAQRRGDAEALKTWDCGTWARRTLKLAQELCDSASLC